MKKELINIGANNWILGIGISRCLDSALRHLLKSQAGWDDEDHERALIWNLFAIIYAEFQRPELRDLYNWKK